MMACNGCYDTIANEYFNQRAASGDWHDVRPGSGPHRVRPIADRGPRGIDVLALHESLERLAAFDPRKEWIVELRYFGGLTIEETAEVVGALFHRVRE